MNISLAAMKKGRAALAVLAAASALLLLIPSGSDGAEDGSASEAESRLESVLAEVEGAGRVRVLCSEEGAAVVCEGAADAAVRLAVTRAVAAYTGLGSNEITVLPMRDE